MRQLALIVGTIAVFAGGLRLLAENPPSAPQSEGGDADAERQRRTDFMKSLLSQYTIAAADSKEVSLAITGEPVLRYTNPVRNFHTDGALFFWLRGQRPLAAGSPTIRGTGQVFCEFSALTAEPLEGRRDGRVAWAPRSGNLADQSLAGAKSPGQTDRVRLRQMRELARRFHVITRSEPDVELRLMTQPIYRFSAEGEGILDGAVFAFVEATDPDFLFIVEAHRDPGASTPEWRYTLARLCSRPVEVKLDGQPLWSANDYWTNPRAISDSYAEKLIGSNPPP